MACLRFDPRPAARPPARPVVAESGPSSLDLGPFPSPFPPSCAKPCAEPNVDLRPGDWKAAALGETDLPAGSPFESIAQTYGKGWGKEIRTAARLHVSQATLRCLLPRALFSFSLLITFLSADKTLADLGWNFAACEACCAVSSRAPFDLGVLSNGALCPVGADSAAVDTAFASDRTRHRLTWSVIAVKLKHLWHTGHAVSVTGAFGPTRNDAIECPVGSPCLGFPSTRLLPARAFVTWPNGLRGGGGTSSSSESGTLAHDSTMEG